MQAGRRARRFCRARRVRPAPRGTVGYVRNILSLFLNTEGINPWTVLTCLVLASVVEGLGFVTLVPLLMVATDTEPAEPSPLLDGVRDAMTAVGMPLDVGFLIGFVVVALLAKSVLTFLAMQHVAKAIAEFTSGLRSRLIRNLFSANWSYLVQHSVGRMANLVSGQASGAGRAYSIAATFFAQAIQTTGYLVVAFIVSWPIALAATALGSLMVLSLHFLVRISRKAGWRQTQRAKELITLLVDSLNSIKPLKAMAKEDEYVAFLDRKIDSLKKAIRRQAVSQDALKNGSEALATIFLGGGFFLALAIWEVPLIELVVVGVLLKRTSNGMTKLQHLYQQAVASESPYIEAMEMMAEAKASRELNPGTRPATFERECRLEEVSFAHGERQILDAVSLQVPVGGVTVLIGPSGAGKTTIADIILGLYRPDRGRVLLDGVPLDEIDLRSWRRLIGYVPQELILLHDSVYANVALGNPGIRRSDVRKVLEVAGAWGFVDALPDGMMTTVGQAGAKLSGGQRQRIALARALASRPKLLILDEVTSALDPRTEQEICDNIRSMADDTTILAITHRPTFLEIADRIYQVDDQMVMEVRAEQVGRLSRPAWALG
jgi:ATP-binding cassette, subfamily C, bacterial